MVKISIVIVNYNTSEYLSRCIKSIYKADIIKDQIQVVIVDNNSYDSSLKITKEYISKKSLDVEVISNSENLGFSKAVNLGLNKCYGNYICILNPDTYIEKDCLCELEKYMEINLDIGAITPKVINSNGQLQISCKRSLPTIKNSIFKIFGLDKLFSKNKFFSSYNLLYLNENDISDVEVISGAFMFLRKSVFEKVGYFDERFYLYGEDIDYCHRIKKEGFPIIYYPLVRVIHYKGKSAESHPFEAIHHFHSSMIKYYNKYQDQYFGWSSLKFFIFISVIIKKYLSYFYLIIKNIFKLK